jgi:hypothetical protein
LTGGEAARRRGGRRRKTWRMVAGSDGGRISSRLPG